MDDIARLLLTPQKTTKHDLKRIKITPLTKRKAISSGNVKREHIKAKRYKIVDKKTSETSSQIAISDTDLEKSNGEESDGTMDDLLGPTTKAKLQRTKRLNRFKIVHSPDGKIKRLQDEKEEEEETDEKV